MSETNLDFQKIYTDFRPKIQRYLTRMVGEYEAEDLTQEVFIKVSQSLHTFRGASKLSTWIYRIASNTALDRMRSPSFNRIVSNENLDDSNVDETGISIEAACTRDEMSLPEQQIFHKERYACYQGCIKDLPKNYRQVIILSELENLATNEIANVLGLSVETVKMRLHRGRERLLEVLKDHCKAEDWL